jgi:NTP pyrophosphatase (non-canonical NTP hydrolase)
MAQTSLERVIEVLEERQRQDAIYGIASERGITYGEWLTILVEEVGEVAKAINDNDRGELRKELVQVAAVALAFLEVSHA